MSVPLQIKLHYFEMRELLLIHSYIYRLQKKFIVLNNQNIPYIIV
jgi:hypothetical protein